MSMTEQPSTTEQPRICDYEGSDYRTRFWENQGRDYEDMLERDVLHRLLPKQGKRMLEIGAGFGRLSQEYSMYEQVVLLDYSFSQLQYAREQLGDEGYVYVAADAYRLPFVTGAFDGATMIRVIHHFEDAPRVLQGIRHILAPRANFILEFANKRNLKAMLRYALRQQDWNPYEHDPVEFVELNYDFHPVYMQETLGALGFTTTERIPVSFLRLGVLKRRLSADTLVSLDKLLQKSNWLVSPSIFTHNTAGTQGDDHTDLTGDAIFACPDTGGALRREGDHLINEAGTAWEIRDGIYDFKAPVG
jgi:SAM-dependent methyltransferase